MLKCDRWITEQAGQGMIEPFQSGLIRHLDPEQSCARCSVSGVRPTATTCACLPRISNLSACSGHGDESQAVQSGQPRAHAAP